MHIERGRLELTTSFLTLAMRHPTNLVPQGQALALTDNF